MNTIHIAYALNDGYVEQTCVSMTSVVKNTYADVHFHIIEKDLSLVNKEILNSTHEKVTFIKFTGESIDKFPLQYSVTVETYTKLYLSEMLLNIDKVLWLDGDTIIDGDIADIWNHNLGDNLVAMVPYMFGDSLKKAKELGIEQYFNTGVMLCNLKKIRETSILKITLPIVSILHDKLTNMNLPWRSEQDVANYLLDGYISILPLKANMVPSVYWMPENDSISLDEWVEATIKPLVIHYGGITHPSFFNRKRKQCDVEFIKRYYFYKAQSIVSDISNDTERMKKYESFEEMSKYTFIDDEWDYICRNLHEECKRISQEIAKVKKTGKKLVLFGAGTAVRRIMVELAISGVYAEYIVDNSLKKRKSTVFGYPVSGLDMLKKNKDNYFIVLTMLNRKSVQEATEILISHGYNENSFHHIFTPMWNKINEKW